MSNIKDIQAENVCGNCKYYRYDGIERNWVCTNEESYEYSNMVEYTYLCLKHTEKEPEGDSWDRNQAEH